MALEVMPRASSLQNRHAPSNPMAGEPLCDSEAMRRLTGIGPGDDRIPDETAILNLRQLPERHGLTDKGITLRPGRLVDATRIDAPSSSRSNSRARYPGISSTRKGNDRYFGMKAHIGVDADSGVTRSLETSTANHA